MEKETEKDAKPENGGKAGKRKFNVVFRIEGRIGIDVEADSPEDAADMAEGILCDTDLTTMEFVCSDVEHVDDGEGHYTYFD